MSLQQWQWLSGPKRKKWIDGSFLWQANTGHRGIQSGSLIHPTKLWYLLSKSQDLDLIKPGIPSSRSPYTWSGTKMKKTNSFLYLFCLTFEMKVIIWYLSALLRLQNGNNVVKYSIWCIFCLVPDMFFSLCWCQSDRVPNCPFYYLGVNMRVCFLGAKLSTFTILVPYCPGAIMSFNLSLSLYSKSCDIYLQPRSS